MGPSYCRRARKIRASKAYSPFWEIFMCYPTMPITSMISIGLIDFRRKPIPGLSLISAYLRPNTPSEICPPCNHNVVEMVTSSEATPRNGGSAKITLSTFFSSILETPSFYSAS
jgi:hypothetical protein